APEADVPAAGAVERLDPDLNGSGLVTDRQTGWRGNAGHPVAVVVVDARGDAVARQSAWLTQLDAAVGVIGAEQRVARGVGRGRGAGGVAEAEVGARMVAEDRARVRGGVAGHGRAGG